MTSDILDKLLNNTHSRIWRMYEIRKRSVAPNNWNNPGEPALVAGLVSQYFCQRLRTYIGSSLTGLVGVPLVRSFFLHQKPYVTYNNSSGNQITNELADLLLIRHHFVLGNPVPQGWAFLLQAKASTTPRTGVMDEDDSKQFDLYNGWHHDFYFPNGEVSKPSGGDWNFSGVASQDVGVYGIVYKGGKKFPSKQRVKSRFPKGCKWSIGTQADFSVVAGDKSVDGARLSFGEVLKDFLNGSFGAKWSHTPVPNDDWSLFIREIIGAPLGQFPFARAHAYVWPRQVDILSMMTQEGGNDYEAYGYAHDLMRWNATLPGGHGNNDSVRDLRESRPSGGIATLYIGTTGLTPLGQDSLR